MRALIASVLAVLATPAPPVGYGCEGEPHAALDFWVGDWVVEWRRSDGASGVGLSVVSRTEHGGCVVTEEYRDVSTGFSGGSRTYWNRFSRTWVMAWSDNTGSGFVARGAPAASADGPQMFELDDAGGRRFRIVFSRGQDRTLEYRFQEKAGEAGWTDRTVSRYRRRGS